MKSARETESNVNVQLLHHSGNIGTYALQINMDWSRKIGHDPEIVGKTLAQVADDTELSGLVIPRHALYGDALQEQFSDNHDGKAGIRLHRMDMTTHRPELLGDLGFLKLIAGALVSHPENQLGSKVGIVADFEHTITPELLTDYRYNGGEVLGRFVSGKYTILSRGLPKPTQNPSFLRTQVGHAPKFGQK